ncbi:MAG: hypothetical protein ACI9OJ_000304 [Myxococcota bacterium]|jgi:hypothetical protein
MRLLRMTFALVAAFPLGCAAPKVNAGADTSDNPPWSLTPPCFTFEAIDVDDDTVLGFSLTDVTAFFEPGLTIDFSYGGAAASKPTSALLTLRPLLDASGLHRSTGECFGYRDSLNTSCDASLSDGEELGESSRATVVSVYGLDVEDIALAGGVWLTGPGVPVDEYLSRARELGLEVPDDLSPSSFVLNLVGDDFLNGSATGAFEIGLHTSATDSSPAELAVLYRGDYRARQAVE